MQKALIDTIDSGVAILDADLNFTDANYNFLVQIGLPPDTDMVGKSFFDFFADEDRDRRALLEDATRGIGCERRGDTLVLLTMNRKIELDWSARPIIEDNGAVEFVLMQTRVLKPIESQLRQERAERERLAYALSGAADGIWDWDFLTGAVYFSDRYCEMLGYAQGELEHSFKTWESLVHPDDFQDAKDTINSYVNGTAEKYHSRFRMTHKSGRGVWILARGQVVEFAADGTPRRLAGTHTDITDQVELEVQLLDAKKQAEDAAEAERVFLSTMSHEIRTPLTGMIGMLDSMVGGTLDAADKERLTTSRRSASTLLSILNSVLNLSELKSGTFQLRNKDFNVREMFEQAIAIYRSKAKTKGIDVDLTVKPSANRWANSDPERLTQVLYNLVSNAIKFSDSGTIKITVTCADSESEDDGMTLSFVVQDQGIGITPYDVDHIFDRFYQVDSDLDRAYQGTGLGLHIVQEIVTVMGGNISVTSELGEGTVFRVSMPIKVGSHARETTEQVGKFTHVANASVLVAEDIEVNRRILDNYLKKLGCTYTMVPDGQAAIDICRQEVFDVVLMDIQMPRVNGVDAIKVLRAEVSDYETVPLIALTANVFANDVQSYFDAGATDHLAKPFTFQQLASMLGRHTKNTATPKPDIEARTRQPEPVASSEPDARS